MWTDDRRVFVMLLRRSLIFIAFSYQSVMCSAQREGTRDNNGNNNISIQHEGEVNNSNSRRSLKLKKNATASLFQLNDEGRYLKAYNLVTCDGYILNVFRMTFLNNETIRNKFPVLLVHGLYQSSDRFIDQKNKHALAFLLQDLGYDVWLANSRGNKYGRQHIYLEPDTENVKFFNYSYEEIAIYDIPLIVDYILNDTSKQKVHYIGHSLGGTVFLVLNSLNPEYNNKFATAHLLAPIGYQNYFPDSDLTFEASRADKIYGDLMKQGKVEIFPYAYNVLRKNENQSSSNIQLSVEDCLGDKTYQNICQKIKIDKFMDLHSTRNSINKTRGGSIKLLAHLAQNVKTKTFSRWDYGEKENEKIYGTKESPEYNLGLITAATKIIYAPNDEYVSPKDIADMAKEMANCTTMEVSRKDFKHSDFIVAPDLMENVYNDIVQDLRNSNRITTRNTDGRKDNPEKDHNKIHEGKEVEHNGPKHEPEHEEDDEDDEDEPKQVIEKPQPTKSRTRKQVAKFRVRKQKLGILPNSWWVFIIFWVPKMIIPITIVICLIIFFCCLKKVHTNFAVTLKNDKGDEE